MKKLLLFGACLLFYAVSDAQPANNDCNSPILIPEVSNWCSERDAYTNEGATPSGYEAPECFSGEGNDVWLSFVANATDANIVVRGNTRTAPGGSLSRPEIALYFGDCGGSLSQLGCESDRGNHLIELYEGGLIVGATYLIRVQGNGENVGTFQLCINNYNPPTEPSSDCPTASVLCDKSPFVVQSVRGAGMNNREMDDGACFSNGSPGVIETNSSWFTWICDESGTLEFALTPTNEVDDLDFIVYELPNGVGDCSEKQVLRCMASGSARTSYPTPCHGPTGLREESDDPSENAGCASGDDNFASAIQMESGKTYALAINNFTSTGNGFEVDFGGTGTFLGPVADFEVVSEVTGRNANTDFCIGEALDISDLSSFQLGTITNWSWQFGIGAEPNTAIGEGPHDISYTTPGRKSIVLTIESNLGCIVTEILTLNVKVLELEAEFVSPDCGGIASGAIEITPVNGTDPYEFNWQNTGFVSGDNILEDIPEGEYTVVVRDMQGCEAELTVELLEPGLALNSMLEPVIEPSCFGFSDGQIIVNAAEGTPPYEIDFGNGFTPSNTLMGVDTGSYTIEVRDAVGCDETFVIEVGQPDSLEIGATSTDISCFGIVDGTAMATANGGVGDYSYNWSNTDSGAAIDGLAAGDYIITAQDANGCEILDSVQIIEPPELFAQLENVDNISCFGAAAGGIEISGLGGRPPFEFSVNGNSYQASPNFEGLTAGTYELFVRDVAGCTQSLLATITQPGPFFVDAGEDQEVELGYSVDLQATTSAIRAPFTVEWTTLPETLSCVECFNPEATPFNTTIYTILVRDSLGCVVSDEVEVRVFKNRPIYIPNIFSPNDDNNNDFFTIYGGPAAASIQTLKIFSRWGELVFEGNNLPLNEPSKGWNGKLDDQLMNPAVFAFYVEIAFIDGEVVAYEGDLTLLR